MAIFSSRYICTATIVRKPTPAHAVAPHFTTTQLRPCLNRSTAASPACRRIETRSTASLLRFPGISARSRLTDQHEQAEHRERARDRPRVQAERHDLLGQHALPRHPPALKPWPGGFRNLKITWPTRVRTDPVPAPGLEVGPRPFKRRFGLPFIRRSAPIPGVSIRSESNHRVAWSAIYEDVMRRAGLPALAAIHRLKWNPLAPSVSD